MTRDPRIIRTVLQFLSILCVLCGPSALAKPAPSAHGPQTPEWHDQTSASGRTYRIVVWEPKGPPPAPGFPVIYVLDGNAWAPLVADILNVFSSAGNGHEVAPAIVVGIGYPTDAPFDMVRRIWDLTTPSDKHRNVIPDRNGGYTEHFAFIESTVKPDIERRYPVDRARQTLLGHSLGGLFVLRTVLEHPSAYQNYLALSPSIWWDDAALLRDVKAFQPDAGVAGRTRIYLGVGELEQHMTPSVRAERLTLYRKYAVAHPEILQGRSVDDLVAALEDHNRDIRMVDNARDMGFALESKGFSVRFDSFPDEEHFSVVPAELSRALPFALKP